MSASADHGAAELERVRKRFLRAADRALLRAARTGVSYEGAAPDAVADDLQCLARDIAAQLAP